MKVIIACLNSKYVHASLAPWCLLAGVRAFAKDSINAQVFESTINGSTREFAEKIIAQKPKVLTFSCYIWNITKTLEVCEIVKKSHPCTIVLGGPEVAYRAQNVLENYPYVDFVLSGEGEWTFPQFLNNFQKDLSVINGLSYRKNDMVITNPEAECTATPPSPYSEEFFENLKGRISYIETSRGCPYRCAFCLSGRCSNLRFFDLEQMKADVLKLANSGTQTVKFVDRTFNANAKRANEILCFIKENYGKGIPDGVCFHLEIAGDILKDSTLEILSQMPIGAVQLEIGMQSFNHETLKAINRKTDVKKLVENIKKLVSFGNMHIHIDLIAGLSLEDLESFKNSFNIGYSLGAHMLQMGFLKLLYGADMRENTEKYPCTFSSEPPYEVTSTPWLSNDELQMLKRCEDALDRLYNSGRFLFTLEYLIDETGIAPFDVFTGFGNAVSGNKMPLSQYSLELYHFFKDKCDCEILKEKILCDLLSCATAVQIPEIFKTKTAIYKQIKKHFMENVDKNIKIAILYKTQKVFAVNQKRKNLHGRYQGEFYPIENFIAT